MAKLVIKGHKTRGKEVIEILKMLGGAVRVPKQFAGHLKHYGYYINSCGFIEFKHYSELDYDNDIIYSLEEFLEKYPYKVGDKASAFDNKWTVIDAVWDGSIGEVIYTIKSDTREYTTTKLSNQLQPYEEETVGERKYADLRLDVDQDDKLATEATIDGDKIIPPENYLIGKITKVDNGALVEFVKKQPQYPKTYEECCKIMGVSPNYEICIHEQNTNGKVSNIKYSQSILNTLDVFKKLLICRDAYWKIAGEEMGLDKPWEPDYLDDGLKHCIYFYEKHISINSTISHHHILVFPSEKITKIFAENFIYLINECWQLLK